MRDMDSRVPAIWSLCVAIKNLTCFCAAHISLELFPTPAKLLSQGAMMKGTPMFKNVEEMQKYGKDQFDAFAAVSTAYTKGVQQIATEATDYTKKSFEAATATGEKLAAAKSFEAAVQVQTDYAKQAYEAFIAQSKKMGDLLTSLGKDTMKPVESAVAKAQASK
jgi:hypothetical protein